MKNVIEKRKSNNRILFRESSTNEPLHDKTNKVSVRPAKTQISLGIRPVWVTKDPIFRHADSED